MRIVIDARVVRVGMTGVGRYTAELLARLPVLSPDDEFIFLVMRGQQPALRPYVAPEAGNVQWFDVDMDYEKHPGGDIWEQLGLPRMLNDLDAELFHGPAYMVPFMGKPLRAARVVTLHDLSVFTLPEAYPWKFRTYLRWVISRSLRVADRVICVSEFVRGEALARFPSLPPEKFVVIPSAPSDRFRPSGPDDLALLRRRHQLPDHFLLMVGTLETRKNPLFFQALDTVLRGRMGEAAPPVIWAGHKGHQGGAILDQMQDLVKAGRFQFMEHPDAGRLLALYQCADALVYPSLNEGFGLPILEAMACGLPVIASDATSLPEVVGRGGVCIPVDRPEAWAEEIAGLLQDSARGAEASRRALEWAGGFTWEKTARLTRNAYNFAAASHATD